MANSPPHTESDSGGAIHVESVNAFQEVLANEQTVLVDFYADWCGPCQMMSDTVDKLASESTAAVAKVDIDELPAIAAEYEIRSIPAFVVFKDGTPTERLIGMQEKGDLRSALDA